MLEKIFCFIIFFSSLGVFIKLKRYGAPTSSIFYSPTLAGAVFLLSVSYGFEKINQLLKERKISKIIAIKVYTMYLIKCIKSIPIMTGIMCVELGKRRIGANDILKFGVINLTKEGLKKIYTNIIQSINLYNISVKKDNLLFKKI